MEDAEGGGNDDKVIDRTTRSEGEAVIDIRDSGKSKDEWLAGFAEASDRWFWEMDENLRFTWISKNLELYLNGPREWHYGKTRGEIGAPDVPSEIWADHLETLRQHRPFKDFIYRRSGPSDEKWLTTSGVPMFDAKGKFQGYRGTGGDVTALMRAKEEASRNAALVEQAVDGMSELFLLCDENDKIVLYNQTFKEVNAAIIDRVSPGMRFEDFVRLIISAGMVPEAIGREEEYFEERMSYHRN
ncbi:MAG: PAS domain-containing protein, partial [Proteobacteria bacterium]|nr:PAS domain-containing protein [Pseudomonadota bacterium]